ncbi:MAG: hypothetical protein AB8G99_14005 [Planctomycetaceae bacterium]
MSDSLAIEWGDERIVLLQGKTSGKHVVARKALVLSWPEEIEPSRAPDQAAQWLKGELTSHGFSAKQAIVSLPRETVVVRHLELPNIPDGELPDMVRLQAATKVTLSADKYLLDYVPLPPRGAETRDVLMTTVPTEVTNGIKRILGKAGLEIASIGVSSLHSGELVVQQQDAKVRAANQLHLSVALAGNRVELALLRGKCALAASSTRLDVEGEARHKAINAEVNRLRLSAQELHGGLPISHVWVTPAGTDAESVCDFLKDKLHCDGSCFDPLGGTGDVSEEDRGYFATTAGHLFASHGAVTESVNYLSPRKPVQKQDRRKIMMILGGVAAVALLGASYWLFQRNLANKDAMIAGLNAEIQTMKDAVREGKEDLGAHGLLSKWAGKKKDWLEQVEEINGLLPSRDIILVEQFAFRPGKDDQRLSLQIGGIARSQDDAAELADILQKRGYKVNPPNYEESNRDEDYETEFTISAVLPMESES